MNPSEFLAGPPLWAELRHGSLHVHNGREGSVLRWTTGPDGLLTAAGRRDVIAALQLLAPRKAWQTRGTLWCALPGRGASVRRFAIPGGVMEDLRRVVALQVETEFPVPPGELAWGWRELSRPKVAEPGDGPREILVAAARRDVFDDCAEVFAAGGFQPVFTLAALQRGAGVPGEEPLSAMLDPGPRFSEMILFKDGQPKAFRMIPWGFDRISEACVQRLGVRPDQVDGALADWASGDPGKAADAAARAVLAEVVAPLADALRKSGTDGALAVDASHPAARLAVAALKRAMPGAAIVEWSGDGAPGRTTAVGVMQASAASKDGPILRLEATPTAAPNARRAEVPWPWVARAAALAAAVLLAPYAKAVVGRPILERRLAALRKDQGRLAEIDRRLEFLQYLEENQPPYIDAAYVLANAAPPGGRIESLTMNRRGEVSLGGYAQTPQQVVDFRSKMMESKFFSSVVVEEQTPVQNGMQRCNFRIAAQWKGQADRERLALGPELPPPPKPGGATNPAAAAPAAGKPAAPQ